MPKTLGETARKKEKMPDLKELIEYTFKQLKEYGFKFEKFEDVGMFKSYLISSNDFDVNVFYEKGPIHIDLVKMLNKKEYRFDLIHLCNYLNNKTANLEFPVFYWNNKNNSEEMYLKFYNKIFLDNYEKIKVILNSIDNNEYKLFKKYYQKENLKHWK